MQDGTDAYAQDPDAKRRYPLVAAIMSLAVPGLGQLYNAQPAKAVILLLIPLGILLLVPFTGIQFTFQGIASLLLFTVLYRLGVMAEALLTAWRLGAVPLGRFNNMWAYGLFGAVALTLGMGISPQASGGAFGVHGLSVVSDAMAPSLRKDDNFMVDVRPETLAVIGRGDVVALVPPGQERTYVRRVVALGGDTVALRAGTLVLNGEPVLEGYSPGGAAVDMAEVTVPQGAYFVLADDRTQGPDSRTFGPVQASVLMGRALFVYWSPDPERVGLDLLRPGLSGS